MGLLIRLEHPERVPRLRLVGALFTTLGERSIRFEGDALREGGIDALVDACRSASEITVSFARGRLGAEALEHLRALAQSEAGYVDVQAPPAHLRVWRDRSRVSTDERAECELSREQACDLFLSRAGAKLVRGHVTTPVAASLEPLRALLRCTNARVSVDLELPISAACGLVMLFERAVFSRIDGLEAEVPVTVSWPDGAIATHVLYPACDESVARWQNAVTAALPVRWTSVDEVRAKLLERAKLPGNRRRDVELLISLADPEWLARAREVAPFAEASIERALLVRTGRAPLAPPRLFEERPARLDVIERGLAAEAARARATRAFERACTESRLAFARVIRRVRGGWAVRVGLELDGELFMGPGFLSRRAGVADDATIACTIVKASPLVIAPAPVQALPAWVEELREEEDPPEVSVTTLREELEVLRAASPGVLDDLVQSHPDSDAVRAAWCRCDPGRARDFLLALEPGDRRAELATRLRWPAADPALVRWGLEGAQPRSVRRWALRRAAAVADDTPAWRAALAPYLADADPYSECLAACCFASWGERGAMTRLAEIARNDDRSLARIHALEWLVKYSADAHVELFVELLDRPGEPCSGIEHRALELAAEGLAAASSPAAHERLFEAVACRSRGLERALSLMVGLAPLE